MMVVKAILFHRNGIGVSDPELAQQFHRPEHLGCNLKAYFSSRASHERQAREDRCRGSTEHATHSSSQPRGENVGVVLGATSFTKELKPLYVVKALNLELCDPQLISVGN
jgi:hypothetical protein